MPIEFEKVADKKPDNNGEIPMTPQEKVRAEIELEKLKKELEAQKLGFCDLSDFEVNKKKQELKEIELVNRESTIETREKIVSQREEDCARAGKINETVKQNLISHDIHDYRKARAVREYAFNSYYSSWTIILEKLYNCKKGVNCIGQIKRGKKLVDEPIAMEVSFFEELKPLIDIIQTTLRKAPQFDKETGEYLEEEQIVDEEDVNDG